MKKTEINNIELNQNAKIQPNLNFKDTWSIEHERILLILHKYSNVQYKLYRKAYIRYKKKLGYYRIPIIIITGIMGLLSISNNTYIPERYGIYVSLLVGISNVFVSIISLIENFKKIDIIKTQSLESYNNYKKINDELSFILRIPLSERSDTGINTVNKFFDEFEKCQTNSPVLKIKSTDLFELTKLQDVTNDYVCENKDKKSLTNKIYNLGKTFYDKNTFDLSMFNSNDTENKSSGSNSDYSDNIDTDNDINNFDDLKNIINNPKNSNNTQNLKVGLSNNKSTNSKKNNNNNNTKINSIKKSNKKTNNNNISNKKTIENSDSDSEIDLEKNDI